MNKIISTYLGRYLLVMYGLIVVMGLGSLLLLAKVPLFAQSPTQTPTPSATLAPTATVGTILIPTLFNPLAGRQTLAQHIQPTLTPTSAGLGDSHTTPLSDTGIVATNPLSPTIAPTHLTPTISGLTGFHATPTPTPTITETIALPTPTISGLSGLQSTPTPTPTLTPTMVPPTLTPTPTPTMVPPTPTPTPTMVAISPTQAPPAEPMPSSSEMQQMRAFWVASYNEGFRNRDEVDTLIANVLRANANTLFVQMRRHGDAWYTRSFEPRAADPNLAPAESFDALDYLIEQGHAHGITIHAWLVASVVCRDHDDLRGHPDHVCTKHGPDIEGPESWTTRTYDGEPVGDLDPGHPSAIHYMESLVTHMLQNYPQLDGLHFDFIRYSGKSYGYNPVSVDRFNRAHNLPLHHIPDPYDPDWEQWRRDRMTELMRRMYLRSKSLNQRIQISIAAITWGGPDEYNLDSFQGSAAYARVFQDWQGWLQEGIIDFAVPMHYFEESQANNRSWMNGWLAWDHANVGKRAIVPGLGSWMNTIEENVTQVQRSLAPDAEGNVLPGVAFYAYHHICYECDGNPQKRGEFLDVLRDTLFQQPASPPKWQWIENPTTGHLQGMALIDGEIIPNAKISLIQDGVWVRDLTASVDGWYGVVELDPGTYTILVQDMQSGRKAQYDGVVIYPGVVSHGS